VLQYGSKDDFAGRWLLYSLIRSEGHLTDEPCPASPLVLLVHLLIRLQAPLEKSIFRRLPPTQLQRPCDSRQRQDRSARESSVDEFSRFIQVYQAQ